MSRKSTIYDVYLNAVREKENKFYMDMLKSEKYTNFVKLMVDAAKEGESGMSIGFDRDDNPDQIKEKWMFIKHIIKSFKYQFEYKISLYYNSHYNIKADYTKVKQHSNPKTFYVLWAEHNKSTKQNIIKFIICLVSLIGIWFLLLTDLAYKPEPNFVSFIVACAILPVTLCSLGYSYKFGKELYYHYFGWYLILRGIEKAGF